MPWDRRSDTLPLDMDELATAMFLANGDLEKAASLYKIDMKRLKAAIRRWPKLQFLLKRLAEPI